MGEFVVTTRVFGVSVGGVSTSALVPFADMLNHSRERGVALADWHYDDDTKGFSLVTNGSSRLSVGQSSLLATAARATRGTLSTTVSRSKITTQMTRPNSSSHCLPALTRTQQSWTRWMGTLS